MKIYRQSNRKRVNQSKPDFGEAKRPTIEDLNNVNYQDIYESIFKVGRALHHFMLTFFPLAKHAKSDKSAISQFFFKQTESRTGSVSS